MKHLLRMILSRTSLIGLLLLLQIALFFVLIYYISNIRYVSIGLYVISTLIVIYLIYREENPIYKLSWIIPILIFPLFGGLFYLFYRSRNISNQVKQQYMESEINRASYVSLHMSSNQKVLNYLNNFYWPAYDQTDIVFLNSGEAFYEDLKNALKNANKFILLEFFIINPGQMWDEILDILTKKAKSGVEVKLIYDDFGSNRLPFKYPQTLKKLGIEAYQFNRMRMHLNFAMNYRDHKKIVVIDNEIAYTGGTNIGDEYINIKHPYGHWQDAGIKVKGKAVWSLTLSFLQTYHFVTHHSLDFNAYRLSSNLPISDALVAPFADGPINGELLTKNVYLSLITKAKREILITTPYLIIDYELSEAIKLAVKSGIKVKIVIPNIPDKKIVYMVTETYANELFSAGVQIYRYRPGFIHSKMMVVDGLYALIGSANFDFRSLYLHFENSVYLSHVDAIKDMTNYVHDIILQSNLMDKFGHRNFLYRLVQYLIRGFASLM